MKISYFWALGSLTFFCNLFVVEQARSQQIPNITWGQPGTMLSSSDTVPAMGEMGRLAIMDTLGGYVVSIPEGPGSTADSNLRTQLWDLSDPLNPGLVENFSRTRMPYQAHGTVKIYDDTSGGVQVDLGAEEGLLLSSDGSVTESTWIGTGSTGLINLSTVAFPWAATNWGSYEFVSSQAQIFHDNQLKGEWDQLGTSGIIGFALLMGDLLLYASDQANSGIASYDVSDPSNPRLLDLFNEQIGPPGRRRGVGGYQAEIYGHYVVFASRPNDVDIHTGSITAIDFSDPENLRLHCYLEIPTEPMYVNFQDDHAFIDRSKVNIDECRVDLQIPWNGHDMSQFSLPLGNLLVAGGLHFGYQSGQSEQGMSVWVHQSEPDTRPPFVKYHIPQDGRANYPVFAPISIHIPEKLRGRTMVPGENIIVRPVGGSAIGIDFRVSHSGLLTIDPDGDLQPGTTYEVVLDGIEDYMGNAMLPYSFQFTTAGTNSNPAPPVISNVVTVPSPVTAGDSVSFSVVATGTGGLEYRFDPGNGDGLTNWTSSNTFLFAYDAGTYQPRLFVRDSAGQIDSEFVQLAVLPLQPDPGIEFPLAHNDSQLACRADSESVWTINPDNNSVVSILKSSLSVEQTISDTEDPRSIVIASDGTIWVAGMGSDSIDIYNSNGSLIRRINTGYGSAPYGLVADHGGSNIYASLYGSGELLRMRVSSRTETGRIFLGSTPRALAITPDDTRILVSRHISPQNRGEIWDVNLSSFSLRNVIALQKEDDADSLISGHGVPNYISAIAIDPSGDRAYYVGKKDNVDKGLLTDSDALDDDNTVRAILGTIDIDNSRELYSSRRDIDNRSSPSALTFSPTADYLFVALQGNNEVLAFPRNENGDFGVETGFFEAGFAPQSVCMDVANEHLYVKNFLGRSISQVNLGDFLQFGSLNPVIDVVNTVSNEMLPADVLAGKRIFYDAGDDRMSLEGYISCASCHIDGGHDGRIWDFSGRGEGLRNTISLNGKEGVSFGPAHWSGNFDEIQDFEHDIRERFKGLGFLTNSQYAQTSPLGASKTGLSQDLDNLASYVTSLGEQSLPRSPFRTAAGNLTQGGVAGAAIFDQQGCGSCHSNDWFTDGQMHDVGTLTDYSGGRLGGPLEGIQTPSLLGVFDSAPYLHDGRANTLSDVFTTIGGTVHQAENAQLNGAIEVSQSVFRNFRRDLGAGSSPTAVLLDAGNSSTILFDGVDGGIGGNARLTVRGMGISEKTSHRINVKINENVYSVSLDSLELIDGEQPGMIDSASISFNLQPGGNNSIEISNQELDHGVYIDYIIVGNTQVLEKATPHLRVSQLSDAEQSNLVSYLRQIDRHGQPDAADPGSFDPEESLGNPDTFVTEINTPILIAFESLLSNDRVGGEDLYTIPFKTPSGEVKVIIVNLGDDFEITGVRSASNGTVEFKKSINKIVFSPDNNFLGEASFEYLLSNGEQSANIKVLIEVLSEL